MPTESGGTDPILDELHEVRRQMLTECGGDLEKLLSSLQKREAESDRRFMRLTGIGGTLAAGGGSCEGVQSAVRP